MSPRLLKAKLLVRAQQSELAALRESLRGPINYTEPAVPARKEKA